MKHFIACTLAAICATTLTACDFTDPVNYETAPVTVKTQYGEVTCQLYTKEIVRWDRPIDWPAGMTVQQAFAVCQIEGIREQKGAAK